MMKRSKIWGVSFLLLSCIFSQLIVISFAWEIDKTASVTSVIDGDSFYITGDEVRLADVSAPEWNMPGGTEATNALFNLISGKIVYLDTDQKSGRGPHGRLIAVVYIKHNSTHYKNVNEALLRLGGVSEDDYTNNEFSPSTWTLFVRYASNAPPPPLPTPPLPPFLSDLTVTPSELELGDNVTIGLDVMNPNNRSITYIVTMRIGELTLLVDVELEAYESTTVSRTLTMSTVGVFNVTVDGLTGSFTVKAPPKPAEFEFSDLRIFYPGVVPPEVERGQTVTVTISIEVKNVGEVEGGRTVELKVDGEVIDSKGVTLEGGASATVLFELTRGEGTHEVKVEGYTESFTVNPQPSFWDKIPGFPYEAIILGLIAVIIIILRSRSL